MYFNKECLKISASEQDNILREKYIFVPRSFAYLF